MNRETRLKEIEELALRQKSYDSYIESSPFYAEDCEKPEDIILMLINELRAALEREKKAKEGMVIWQNAAMNITKQLDIATEALKEITKVKYGLELGDTDEQRAYYFSMRNDQYIKLAQIALSEISRLRK